MKDPSKPSFLWRHLRGEYSLARSFWLHCLGFNHAFAVVFGLSAAILATPLRFQSPVALVWLAVGILIWAWGAIGVWASSRHHVARGGRPLWAILARASIVIFSLLIAGSTGLQASSKIFWYYLHGGQPGDGFTMQVSVDGRSIRVTGSMNTDFARALGQAIESTPSVKIIDLDSVGGWVDEGVKAAKLIAAHDLSTYVEGTCESSCTLAFLAGDERVATAQARIGFHRSTGTAPGVPEFLSVLSLRSDQFLDAYRAADLPGWFIDRAQATRPTEMWHPTTEELLESRVITRLSAGGETAALATYLRDAGRLATVAYLSQLEPYASLASHQPEGFKVVLDAVFRDLEAGEIDSTVYATLDQESYKLQLRLLSDAPDELLLRLVSVALDRARALRTIHRPDACYFSLWGPRDYSTYNEQLPTDLLDREEELVRQVVTITQREAPPIFSADDVAAALLSVEKQLSDHQLEGLTVSEDESDASFEARCDAAIAYFTAVLSLPTRQRSIAIRGIYRK